MGTTAYAWTHQGDELEEQTLRTLERSPFNRVRTYEGDFTLPLPGQPCIAVLLRAREN
ncbi:hypothetical protein [Streptomyces sp. NPDC048277]|uniref:hypothetical protein n=1 Tax=Streptomyces sp. NPDC048277 TaxID=3155027 RepID=UPI0033E29E92